MNWPRKGTRYVLANLREGEQRETLTVTALDRGREIVEFRFDGDKFTKTADVTDFMSRATPTRG